MFEAASFADASFSPKNRCEAGGCKVISHKENTIILFHEGVKPALGKTRRGKKTINRGNTIWLISGFLDSPPCAGSLGSRCFKCQPFLERPLSACLCHFLSIFWMFFCCEVSDELGAEEFLELWLPPSNLQHQRECQKEKDRGEMGWEDESVYLFVLFSFAKHQKRKWVSWCFCCTSCLPALEISQTWSVTGRRMVRVH